MLHIPVPKNVFIRASEVLLNSLHGKIPSGTEPTSFSEYFNLPGGKQGTFCTQDLCLWMNAALKRIMIETSTKRKAVSTSESIKHILGVY